MPARVATQNGHHHKNHGGRHRPKFPPQEYTDLTNTDIALLAPILIPPKPTESHVEHDKKLKLLISQLPSHLQSKHPRMSTFCTKHSEISPLPVTSLFNTLREEIEDAVPETWGPLVARKQLCSQKREMVEIVQHLAALWEGAAAFERRFGKQPRQVFVKRKASKCAACNVTMLASDFQTQVAMAALFIGRVTESKWKSSKRIQWFLEWTAASVPKSRRDEARRLIWEIGKKFRITRIGAYEAKSKKVRIKSRLDQAEEAEFGPGTASYPFSLDVESAHEEKTGAPKMIGSRSQEEVEAEESEKRRESHHGLFDGRPDSGEFVSYETPLPAQEEPDTQPLLSAQEPEDVSLPSFAQRLREPSQSSVYSRSTSGKMPASPSIARDIEDIISLYREGSACEEQSHVSGSGYMSGSHVVNPFADEVQS
ncbi:hypothetical protein WHR41_03510 [Cladosporium halotolerans]|uniref:Uncharacterized protein n=1 Tax=Cladosporium halotolerans TaxID=1052096 RepID=A0AB34KSN1_9PEZI